MLFLAAGGFAVLEVLVSLLVKDELNFNLGVLALWIGAGLLRLRRGWRTCALVFLWFSLIGLPIIGLLFVARGGPLDLNLLGLRVGEVSVLHGLAFGAALFAVVLWEYRVLTRPEIRRLFDAPPPSAAADAPAAPVSAQRWT